MKLIHGIPLVCMLLSIACCQRPAHLNSISEEEPSFVFRARLSDTISIGTLTSHGVADVWGIKVMYASGRFASYFEYEAEPETVINMLSSLPFNLYASRADALCHTVDHRQIHETRSHINTTEVDIGSFFWLADDNHVSVECIKPPFRHLLRIHDNRIVHRVATL